MQTVEVSDLIGIGWEREGGCCFRRRGIQSDYCIHLLKIVLRASLVTQNNWGNRRDGYAWGERRGGIGNNLMGSRCPLLPVLFLKRRIVLPGKTSISPQGPRSMRTSSLTYIYIYIEIYIKTIDKWDLQLPNSSHRIFSVIPVVNFSKILLSTVEYLHSKRFLSSLPHTHKKKLSNIHF